MPAEDILDCITEFRLKVLEHLEEYGSTQSELAAYLGFSKSHISRMLRTEYGAARMPIATAFRIAAFLEVPLSELVTREEPTRWPRKTH